MTTIQSKGTNTEADELNLLYCEQTLYFLLVLEVGPDHFGDLDLPIKRKTLYSYLINGVRWSISRLRSLSVLLCGAE